MLTIFQEEDEHKAEKREISRLFQRLCHKLDELSNFHFTPKPPRKEVSIKTKTNIPAIVMEEITPTAVSDAATK